MLAGRLREGNTGNPVVVARLRIEGAATAERSDTGAALCTPRTRDEKLRHCSRVLTNDPDQPAAGEQRQRILHGTTREAGRNGNPAMAGAGAPALRSARLRPKMEIHEKSGRAAVMSGEVAHEDINYVVVKTQVRSHAHILL